MYKLAIVALVYEALIMEAISPDFQKKQLFYLDNRKEWRSSPTG